MQVNDYDLAPEFRWIWWTARSLVVTGALLCALILILAFVEMAEKPSLTVIGLVIGEGLALTGFLLSFWREKSAVPFLLASPVVQILWGLLLNSAPMPSNALIGGILFGILPPVVPGVLFLFLLRKAKSKTSTKLRNAAI